MRGEGCKQGDADRQFSQASCCEEIRGGRGERTEHASASPIVFKCTVSAQPSCGSSGSLLCLICSNGHNDKAWVSKCVDSTRDGRRTLEHKDKGSKRILGLAFLASMLIKQDKR